MGETASDEGGGSIQGAGIPRHVAFVVRCSGAATLAYVLASALGLDHPVWSTITSIIVSQDRIDDTRRAAVWRLFGTMVGIVVAVAAGALLERFGAPAWLEIATGVGACAALARRWPDLKVAMWTAPIVYVSATGSISMAEAGFLRGVEVLVGGGVGTVAHMAAAAILSDARRSPP